MNNLSEELTKLYSEIEERRNRIKAIRKEMPREKIENYSFFDTEGRSVNLLELFGESEELLVIHNMGKECRYCTMWADGLRGYNEIIADRMPWVLTSPNDYKTLKEFSEPRGWNFKVLSYFGNSFAQDLGFASNKDGKIMYDPGVSALVREANQIYRVSKDSFGPGDLYNPAWHFFDLFPKGSDGWFPKYDYSKGE